MTTTALMVFAPNIMIRYSSPTTSDLLSTTTSSQTHFATSLVATSSVATSPGTPPKTPTKEAMIGIGISVPIAFLGILLGAVLFIKHRKHKRLSQAAATKATARSDHLSLKPELGTDAETQRYELHGAGRRADAAELDAVDTSYLQEMGTDTDDISPGGDMIKIAKHDMDAGLVVLQRKS